MLHPHPSCPASHHQSGNMLVYILGAIFLMGLLVVLVKGSTDPGAGVDAETLMIRASEVQRYASEVERGVGFIMSNGNSESDIRFSHPNAPAPYSTVMAAPLERQVFHVKGGGAEYRDPPPGINDGTKWQFFANTHIKDLGTDTPASMKAELIMVLPNVTEAFCTEINALNDQNLTLTDVHDPAGVCIYQPGSEFNGTYVLGPTANTLAHAFFTHLPAAQACIRCGGGNLHFYHVLLPR